MPQKEISVLLIDDEVAFVNTLAQRLIIRNIRVNTAYDGEQALSKLLTEKTDVVILDLNMPGMHGMEVLQEVKNKHPEIQVIVLTGHGTDKDEDEAKRLGGFAFLKKPVDIETLEHRIRAAFKENRGNTVGNGFC